MYSMSWKLYRKLHRNGWFKCSSILLSRIIFRTLSDRTTRNRVSDLSNWNAEGVMWGQKHTLLLANVFQREGQPSILSFDNANLSKGTFSDHAKEAEVIEVDWRSSVIDFPIHSIELENRCDIPASLQATGFP